MITDVRLRCGSKDKKRGLNAVQASRPRYSAIPVLAIQLQVSSLRIRESFAGLFIPQEPIPEGSVIIPNAAAVVKGFSGPFGPPNTTNCPTGVQFRRDGGDPLVSGPASLSRGVMPRLRDEQQAWPSGRPATRRSYHWLKNQMAASGSSTGHWIG